MRGRAFPRAFALVNPNRLDESERRRARPSRRGRRRLRARRWRWCATLRARGFFADRAEPDLIDLLDLVALGTVADVARSTGSTARSSRRDSRSWPARRNIGLAALIDAAG